MRSLFVLFAVLAFASPTKDELRKQIAELKVKAFEIQTQVDLLEAQLKDIETAEANQPLPAAKATAPVKVRCAGLTKEGARCTRHAEPGSRFCWQHKSKR
jgi:hypothetical protein